MYESFFGLREPAFTLTPNPEYLYLTERGEEALGRLLYGVERREGFAVVFGDVGTGKTTLCWTLMEKLEERRFHTALIQKPPLSDIDILRSVLQDLGVRPGPGTPAFADSADSSWMANLSKMELTDRLDDFLVERAREGRFTVVIIDEAQNLTLEALEQLRLLSNLETAKAKLLHFIFVGQPELEKKLRKRSMRQLNQRISFRFMTRPLSRKETKAYIGHRLRVAGVGKKLSIDPGALKTIYRYSRGYPRLINMICDRALYTAFLERSFVITARTVRAGYLNVRESDYRSTPLWIRLGAPAAGILCLTLLGIFILNTKRVTLAKLSVSPPGSSPASVSTSASPPRMALLNSDNTKAAGSRPTPPETPKTYVVEVHPPLLPAQPKAVPGKGVEAQRAPDSPSGPGLQAEAIPDGEYYLQVFSFRSRGSADAASRELVRDGFPSFVKLDRANVGGDWFGVYVGPYDNLSTAREIASTLKSTRAVPTILRRRDSR